MTIRGRRGDGEFSTGCRPIIVDAADLIVQERAGHAKRIVGPVQGFDGFIAARVWRFSERGELLQDSGSGQLLLRYVNFGQKPLALLWGESVDTLCKGEGLGHGNRHQHAATGRAALMTGHGLPRFTHLGEFQCLDLLAEAAHQGKDRRDRHEARRNSDGGGDFSARGLEKNFEVFYRCLVTHGSGASSFLAAMSKRGTSCGVLPPLS